MPVRFQNEARVPKIIDLLLAEWYLFCVLLPLVRKVKPRPWSNSGLLAQIRFPLSSLRFNDSAESHSNCPGFRAGSC
jgi:hypothetical protein